MGQQLIKGAPLLLALAFSALLGLSGGVPAWAAAIGSETVLDRDSQPVFSPEMKQQLEGRQRPSAQMATEGHLLPGTWTVKILESRVIDGQNPVNASQPLYNFTLHGTTYTFDRTRVPDPALLLKTAVTIQTRGKGGLDLNDPEVLSAVKQLEKMSNGTLKITQDTPTPGPTPGPTVACTPAVYVLNGATGTWIFLNIATLPAGCTVGSAPGAAPIIGIQNPHTSCSDAGSKVFFDVVSGEPVTPGTGFSTYTGGCGAGIPAVEASSIGNQFVIQVGGTRYRVTFAVGNGGLQTMPYSHFGRYNSLTVSDVSVTTLP
jgi:hypothetical protein